MWCWINQKQPQLLKQFMPLLRAGSLLQALFFFKSIVAFHTLFDNVWVIMMKLVKRSWNIAELRMGRVALLIASQNLIKPRQMRIVQYWFYHQFIS